MNYGASGSARKDKVCGRCHTMIQEKISDMDRLIKAASVLTGMSDDLWKLILSPIEIA